MPALSPDLESAAQEAAETAAAVLSTFHPVREAGTVKVSERALHVEGFVLGLAASDTLIMLRLDLSDLPEHLESVAAYLSGAWDLDPRTLNDLAARLGPRAGQGTGPTSRRHALALRDALGALSGRVAEAARTFAALSAGTDEAERLAAAAARLERFRAREVSRAELDRVLDLVSELLGGHRPPPSARPTFKPDALEEGRRQADAGLGRRI